MSVVCEAEIDVDCVVLVLVDSSTKWIRIIMPGLILLKNILSPSPVNRSQLLIVIFVRILLQHYSVISCINIAFI